MINTLSIISISTALFLVIAIIITLLRRRKEYQIRLEGTRNLIKKTKKLRVKREEQFKEISSLSHMNDTKIESLWLTEIEFYQNICETICAPNDKSIKKVTNYVSKLLTPYYELLNDVSNSSSTVAFSSLLESSDNSSDFSTLEKRYQEKIDENNKLQKQLDILKRSPHAKLGANDQEAPTEETNTELTLLIHTMLSDLSTHLNTSPPSTSDTSPDALNTNYQALLVTLETKLNAFNEDDDEFNQAEALIEQLRFEKVDYLKKYKKSMRLLFNTYKEYAGAFGLDAPQNPDIEIDDFEKFIEDS